MVDRKLPLLNLIECAKEQEDEFSALQSIYWDSNIVDLRKPSVWKISQPLNLKISLKPMESESGTESYVGTDLHFLCPQNYPNVIPEIELSNSVGLSDIHIQELKDELINHAKKFIGEVMIHNLCTYVRTYLHTHNKPPKIQTSCHAEMLLEEQRRKQKKREEEILMLKEQRKIGYLQQKEFEEELRKKQKAAKKEKKFVTYGKYDQIDIEYSRGTSVPPSQKILEKIDNSDLEEEIINDRRRSTSESMVGKSNKNVLSKAGNDMISHDDEFLSLDFNLKSVSSRLLNDFQILQKIGKGGFGDVIKVRNLLDGRYYAIKRIALNPSCRALTKPQIRKITREVKLLSRINHENVVRYYNSWIEINESLPHSASSSPTRPLEKSINNDLDNLDISKNFNEFDNSILSWTQDDISESESESESDELSASVNNSNILLKSSTSDSIVFEKGFSENIENTEEESNIISANSVKKSYCKLQYLYIQMEYCEGSTLRHRINDCLYKNQDQLWRLFREIIEGLKHIHDLGMIHRDLKPVNIFLDSQNHVKIGDFGLATVLVETPKSIADPEISLFMTNSKDASMTSDIGTYLYTSPEILSNESIYNQKVDLYSLGVTFFEMCYHPLELMQERVQVLQALRSPSITFPEDFDNYAHPNQKSILQWLLNHDPDQRPTSHILLDSDFIPPLPWEEQEIDRAFTTAVNNEKSNMHSKLLSIIFSQNIKPYIDYSYDVDFNKHTNSKTIIDDGLSSKNIKIILRKIFEHHGAIELDVPILSPLPRFLITECDNPAVLMDRGGGLVTLPYNSKVSLARYVEKCNIGELKRYSIERCYKRQLLDLHPKQNTICSFDIITTSQNTSSLPINNMIREAEIIYSVQEVINEISSLSEKDYCLTLNHAQIFYAILFYLEVPKDKHTDVGSAFADKNLNDDQQKLQIETRLSNLQVSKSCIENLFEYFVREDNLQNISSYLRIITKKKQMPATLIKQGLHELNLLIALLKSMECKFLPIISLGLLSNINIFSGITFRIFRAHQKKFKKTSILADGGRFDPLLNFFRPLGSAFNKQKWGVGVNIYIDKLLILTQNNQTSLQLIDVLICSTNKDPTIKLNVAKNIWAKGISCDIFEEDTLNEEFYKEVCRKRRIPYLVILREKENHSFFRIDKDKEEKDNILFKENTIQFYEFLQKRIFKESSDMANTNTVVPMGIHRKSLCGQNDNLSNNLETEWKPLNLEMKLVDVKGTYKNTKIINDLQPVLSCFSNKANIRILVIELSKYILKYIASNIETKDEASYNSSLHTILKEFPRDKRYLQKTFDDLKSLKFRSQNTTIVIIYSLLDNVYRIIV